MSEYEYGLFACDGSATQGRAGYGVHGFYAQVAEALVPGPPSNVVTTDGYILRKDIKEETIHLLPTHYVDIYGRQPRSRTSNEAELDALISILTYVIEHPATNVRIYSDSQYTVTGYNQYMHTWEGMDWLNDAGKKRPNWKQWVIIIELQKQIPKEMSLQVTWCKAHNGFIMNEKADVLAGAGTNITKEEFVSIDKEIKTYWKNTVVRNPLLAFKHLYFLANKDHHTPTEYHLGEPGKDPYNLGKKTNACGYSAVILNEPDDIIEVIVNTAISMNGNAKIPLCTLYMDKAFNPILSDTLARYGGLALRQPNVSFKSLNFIKDRVSVVAEQQQLNMMMGGIETINSLLRILKIFLGHVDQSKSDLYEIQEITDWFSEEDSKGNRKALPSIKECTGKLRLPRQVDDKKTSVYLLNSDLPNRFRLVRLANNGAKFYIVSMREGSNEPVRVSFIIQDDTGAGIYSSWYPALIT